MIKKNSIEKLKKKSKIRRIKVLKLKKESHEKLIKTLKKKKHKKRKVFLLRPGTIKSTPFITHRKTYPIPGWAKHRRRARKFTRLINVPKVYKMLRGRRMQVSKIVMERVRTFFHIPKTLTYTLSRRRIRKKKKGHRKLGNKYNFYGERLKKVNLRKIAQVIMDLKKAWPRKVSQLRQLHRFQRFSRALV